jgi:hypothetical protein
MTKFAKIVQSRFANKSKAGCRDLGVSRSLLR